MKYDSSENKTSLIRYICAADIQYVHAFKLWYGKLSIMWLSIEAPLLNVRCTCKAAKVNCTSYCKCIDDQCSNEFTIEQDTRDETFADGVAED